MSAGDRTPKGTIPGVGERDGSGTEVTGYGAGQRHYELFGWSNVLPLPAGRKDAPPSGYTGRGAKTPTARQVAAWREKHPDGNLALYLRPGLLGIDVDHYGEKRGGDTLAELEAELGPLPATWRSSSRPDDPVSGIRLYRVPEGLAWPGQVGPGIETIHSGHRYAVVHPSIHPEGRPYRWYGLDGELEPEPSEGDLPDPIELPELPEAWVKYLTGGQAERPREARGEVLPVDDLLTDGQPCPAVLKGRGKYDAATGDGQARHDSMRDTLLALVRLGEQGHAGTRWAVADLRDAFLADVAGEDREAEKEWQRAEDGAVRRVTGRRTPEDDRRCCGSADGDSGERAATNLPGEFWESRESLRHIRAAAHAGHCSADAVLIAVLVRVSAMVSHKLKMDTGRGLASPNMLGALIGPSGSGKSTAAGVAAELLPRPGYLFDPAAWADPNKEPFHDGLPLGSGEGLAEAFMGWRTVATEVTDPKTDKPKVKTEKVRMKVRSNAYVYVDEGETLTKVGKRDGATIAPALRSAWSGQTLGQQNATAERTRIVPGGTYSLGVLLGYQLGTAGALLGDADGGTPQRVVFASAVDPSIPDQRVTERPGPLDTEAMLCEATGDQFASGSGGKPRTGVVVFPESVKDELWQERHRASKYGEEGDPLDSHRGLVRCKIATALALLAGRGEVTEEDWRLSGLVWGTSRAMRAVVIEHGREQDQRRQDARSDAAVTQAARIAVAQAQAGSTVERIARHLATKVHEKGTQTVGAARKLLAGRDKPLFREALDLAVSRDWLTVDDDGRKVGIGTSKPVES